jgi:hypothetical protein
VSTYVDRPAAYGDRPTIPGGLFQELVDAAGAADMCALPQHCPGSGSGLLKRGDRVLGGSAMQTHTHASQRTAAAATATAFVCR